MLYLSLLVLLLGFIDSAGIPVSAGMDALIILIDVRAPQRAYLTALLAVVGSIGGNLARVMRYGGEAYLAIRLPRMRVTF